MDIDPNDLLSTNVFINEPVLNDEIPEELNEEFKNYYKKEMERKKDDDLLKKLESRDLLNIDDNDNFSFINNIKDTDDDKKDVKRIKKEVKTLISVDSRDRNKVLYPLASNYKIFLGKTYYNVKEVRLASIEFPNTNAVINSTNNLIYWRNKEDIDLDLIDDITQTYPVYRSPLRIGSYVASTLQTEMTNQMNIIKRKNPPNYHYFVITLDFDTDVVKFISLILKPLNVNPLFTSLNTGNILVTAQNHGYSTGDNVYILGATTTSGIPSSILNGFQKITVLNNDTFQYEVSVNASETAAGGGNVIKLGRSAPFQFLFGEYLNTVAQNIGYPLENSSTLIQSGIKSINNFYQVEITAVQTNFVLSNDYVNNDIILQNTGVNLNSGISMNGTYKITHVLNSTRLLISTSSPIYENRYIIQNENDNGSGNIVSGTPTYTSLIVEAVTDNTKIKLPNALTASDDTYNGWWILVTSGPANNNVRQIVNYVSATNTITLNTPLTVTPDLNDVFKLFSAPTIVFNSKVYTITAIKNYNVETVLFTFFMNHNYTFTDINMTIPFYNTTSNPTFDGNNVILGIPSPTTLFIAGSVLPGGSVSTLIPGDIGFTPTHNLLTTKTLKIANVTIGSITTIVTTTEHGLSINDKVSIKNLILTPNLIEFDYTVYTVPDLYTFTIAYHSTNIDLQSISNAFIGTDIVTVKFPNHGFNFIISAINGPLTNSVIIQTQLPHNLQNNDLIRIMETGDEYIDNNSYHITYVSSDTFKIIVSGLPVGHIVNSTVGVLGMANTFRLYNCPVTGGIDPRYLNNVLFKVHEIIDKNTFNFHLINAYAESSESNGINVYISSYKHGFSEIQTNTKNNILNRSINLEGENYAFLCSPQLATVRNTGSVKNIFARIILDQSPGTVVFNYLSNPKRFENVPLSSLDTIDFSVLNYDGTEYIFNDLDYSFTLEITEIVDTIENFNMSSKRGLTDIS